MALREGFIRYFLALNDTVSPTYLDFLPVIWSDSFGLVSFSFFWRMKRDWYHDCKTAKASIVGFIHCALLHYCCRSWCHISHVALVQSLRGSFCHSPFRIRTPSFDDETTLLLLFFLFFSRLFEYSWTKHSRSTYGNGKTAFDVVVDFLFHPRWIHDNIYDNRCDIISIHLWLDIWIALTKLEMKTK